MTNVKGAKTVEQQKTQRYIEVVGDWPLRKGKNELLAHLNDEETTRTEAMTAKCYDCMGGYDEIGDCKVPTCPLHPWMPYREGGAKKRAMSEEARQAAGERMKRARQGRNRAADDTSNHN